LGEVKIIIEPSEMGSGGNFKATVYTAGNVVGIPLYYPTLWETQEQAAELEKLLAPICDKVKTYTQVKGADGLLAKEYDYMLQSMQEVVDVTGKVTKKGKWIIDAVKAATQGGG
jgi:hypothetical protein